MVGSAERCVAVPASAATSRRKPPAPRKDQSPDQPAIGQPPQGVGAPEGERQRDRQLSQGCVPDRSKLDLVATPLGFRAPPAPAVPSTAAAVRALNLLPQAAEAKRRAVPRMG